MSSMSTIASFLLIPQILFFMLIVYLIILAIKALRIYIDKNK
ncbi:hypothetical protein SAMN02746066_02656 [Anaerosporobacter mobilis DSM 15930]|uniref:Oxaloacetate decarboxylase, gamma chain n=1 Tax=Anaerosporobacter mobilis DSM 15930 TaxID=1120996 RepID=A0A1M7KBP6_9FIRM|nr:hypothetical protein SAMN02746066_02656 [Anaerosporobacter mobilis DSM 15930]